MIRSVSALALLCLLAACDRQGSGSPPLIVSPIADRAGTHARKTPIPSRDELAAIASSAKRGLWSDIDAVCEGTCEPPVALVAWNVADPSVQAVKVFLLKSDGSEQLFASGGNVGGQRTGAWVRAGTTFILKRADDGTELDKLVIPGEDC